MEIPSRRSEIYGNKSKGHSIRSINVSIHSSALVKMGPHAVSRARQPPRPLETDIARYFIWKFSGDPLQILLETDAFAAQTAGWIYPRDVDYIEGSFLDRPLKVKTRGQRCPVDLDRDQQGLLGNMLPLQTQLVWYPG